MAEKYESKYYRARIGSGKKVHLIFKESNTALCGAGQCSTGFRRWGAKKPTTDLATCGRCVGIRMRMDGVR